MKSISQFDRALSTAIGAAIVIGLGAATGVKAADAKPELEKCAGIVKAGKNDCGTSYSSCAGTAKEDRNAEAWLLVPKGTCERIAGGKIQTSANAKPGGAKG